VRLAINEIDASFFDADFLGHSFRRYDNVVHPHWHMAAQRVADIEQPVAAVCAGIFGEVMGGHYGPPMVQSGSEKAVTTLRYLVGLGGRISDSRTDPASAMGYLYQDEYETVPWYLDRDTWEDRFKNVHEAVNEDTKLSVDRLVQRGVDTREAVIEAFVTEHRGSQHVAAQLHGAAQYLPIVAPFCTRRMAIFACEVPYTLKFHNSLNQAIIRRLNPELLNFPTAAILVKAKRSVLTQELSRVVRRSIEIGGWKLHDLTNKRTSQPRFGWPNYTFLRQNTDVFDNLIESLRSPLWSKQKIHDNCHLRPHGSYHSLIEMLMKIKTLDLLGIS
jgi:hypothetical protein